MLRFVLIFLLGFSLYSNNSKVDPREFDYSQVDSLMLAHASDTFENPQIFADFINENFKTDHEKFRAIFWWITQNIQYNYASPNESANEVFNSKKAVCNGYSELTCLLCELCKIKCRKISGIAKNDVTFFEDSIYGNRHAWNIVTLNGVEYVTDLTWASGGYDDETGKFRKELSEEYFLPPSTSFILDHFPDKGEDQLLSIPITKKTFCSSPVFFDKAINYELYEFLPSTGNLKVHKGDQVNFSFSMNYLPDKVDVDLYKNEDDKNPISSSPEIVTATNTLGFPFTFDISGSYLMYIQMDFKDAVCYKVEVTE